MHITLVTPSLACGGAERALVLIAAGFVATGHQVSLITIAGKETDFYSVPDKVNRFSLNLAKNSSNLLHAVWNNLHRFWILRRTIESLNPDIVISFMYPANVLTLLSLTKKYPVIVSEQIDPNMNLDEGYWGKLRRVAYPLANKVVSASQGVDQYFQWLPKSQRTVIYNPLLPAKDDDENITSLNKYADPSKKWAVAMGRLDYQKNFELLISAFHKLAGKHSDWQLLIFGEGKLRSQLEDLVDKLGLKKQVFLPGITENPLNVFKNSDLFILSSRFEGFGNVLIEAMACGVPVISTDCPSGPREIICDGVDGILVPNNDVSALATAIEYLMSNEEERIRLASNATKTVKRFQLEKIVEMWESLINQIVEEK